MFASLFQTQERKQAQPAPGYFIRVMLRWQMHEPAPKADQQLDSALRTFFSLVKLSTETRISLTSQSDAASHRPKTSC